MSLVKAWFGILKCSPKIAFWNLMTSFYSSPRLRNDFTFLFVNKKHEAVLGYLATRYSNIIDCYKKPDYGKLEIAEKRIWILWWQGYDNAPELVKSCIASAKRAFKNYRLVLITKENYEQYISVPDYIITKFEAEKITYAQLSDIFRFNLLSKHGGIWLDATLFFPDTIPDVVFREFFTLNTGYNNRSYFVAKGRWTGFFMSTNRKHLPFFEFANELILEYWKKNNSLVDYFLIDYIIALAYEEFPYFKETIDALPQCCNELFALVDSLSEIATSDRVRHIFSAANWCYKLNHRVNCSKEINGKLTLYGKLIIENPAIRL